MIRWLGGAFRAPPLSRSVEVKIAGVGTAVHRIVGLTPIEGRSLLDPARAGTLGHDSHRNEHPDKEIIQKKEVQDIFFRHLGGGQIGVGTDIPSRTSGTAQTKTHGTDYHRSLPNPQSTRYIIKFFFISIDYWLIYKKVFFMYIIIIIMFIFTLILIFV